MEKTVGRFSMDADGTFSGPAEYMGERGNALLDLIVAGADATFNATAHYSPDVETAILVRVQTDFAAWHGARTLFAEIDAAAALRKARGRARRRTA
jgi:hypothetical protein